MSAMSQLPPDDRVGKSIGPYKVEAVLGVGGMGRVYRATGPEGEVALKLVKADLARDATFRRRFDREARIAQQIKHPHVVPVLDTGEEDGIPYLAQQFVGNGSLEEKLKSGGTLDVETTVTLCGQIASGLDALNEAGLIHRDVKPANILLDVGGTAFITDFGLAKDTQGSVLTRPGQALGSMDYMSPEQIRGEDVTAASDVYALGCVAFECLCGSPPFADRQGMHILWAHLQDDPPDPRSKREELSVELGKAILSAMEKNPANRPQTAGDFARMLEGAKE